MSLTPLYTYYDFFVKIEKKFVMIYGSNKVEIDEKKVIKPIKIPTIPTPIAKRRKFFCLLNENL